MEILVPSLLRIKPHALYKVGKYLRNENLKDIAIFYGQGIKEMLHSQMEISFESSEIKVCYEEVVTSNDIELAFKSAQKLPGKVKAIVAVGGGLAIDYCKYVGFITHKPVISIPTITSNDGFCSPLSSLYVNGKRKTVKTSIPYGVILDTLILKSAPEKYMYSGIGDLFCKVTAIFDWKLAYKKTGEYVNDFAAVISKNAVDTFIYYENKDLSDPQYLGLIASSLLMNGIAMEIAGSSRPASGSEHLISHAYDKVAKKSSHHGLQVGVASYCVSYLQKATHDVLKKTIIESGFYDFMCKNPLDKDDFIEAVHYAPEIKENFYTILSEKDSTKKIIDFIQSDEMMQKMLGR